MISPSILTVHNQPLSNSFVFIYIQSIYHKAEPDQPSLAATLLQAIQQRNQQVYQQSTFNLNPSSAPNVTRSLFHECNFFLSPSSDNWNDLIISWDWNPFLSSQIFEEYVGSLDEPKAPRFRVFVVFVVLTTFWSHLWSITEQTHGNMDSFCFIQ